MNRSSTLSGIKPAPTRAHYDRRRFTQRLQRHFKRRGSGRAPFLLVAIRMDGSPGMMWRLKRLVIARLRGLSSDHQSNEAVDFNMVSDLAASMLRPTDDLYIDAESERILVFLNNTRDDQSQEFFYRLRQRLEIKAPQQADYLLHVVSAVTLPDGQPFTTADECVARVLS
jgi:hypothetical protein